MKQILLLVLTYLTIFSCGQKRSSTTETSTAIKDINAFLKKPIYPITDSTKIKRFVILIAPRAFRDEEYKIPYEFLTKIGHKIKVASRDTIVATGVLGLSLKPQLSVEAIDTLNFDGIILAGGPGSAIYWDDPKVHRLVQYFARTPHKIVAAICIAPVTLARAGILAGKRATVYEDRETLKELKKHQATYQKADVIIDGNIITANGPAAAEKFAKAIALLAFGN